MRQNFRIYELFFCFKTIAILYIPNSVVAQRKTSACFMVGKMRRSAVIWLLGLKDYTHLPKTTIWNIIRIGAGSND
jgi:hypothetical protein